MLRFEKRKNINRWATSIIRKKSYRGYKNMPHPVHLVHPAYSKNLYRAYQNMVHSMHLNIYAKSRILTRQVPLFPQQEALSKNQEPIF